MAKRLCIAFQSRSLQATDPHRDWAVAALESGLAPYLHRLGQVLVRLLGPGDPGQANRGEALCSIRLDVLGHSPIQAQSQDPDPREALREALARTRRQLERIPLSEPGQFRAAR